MCLLRINTNVPASDIDEKFFELTVESLAKTFQKPKSDILVLVNGDQSISIAGSEEPAALVMVLDVNGINDVNNKLHSAALFSLLKNFLKVNEDRIVISFTAVEPHNMGINGKTFGQ